MSEFGYAMIALAIILLLFIRGIYLEKDREKRLLQRIRDAWGKIPEEEYTTEKLVSIAMYYMEHKNLNTDIDDITWNDLNMEDIYMLINNTGSSIGEEYLYFILHRLEYDENTLKERNRILELLKANTDLREKLQLMFHKFGKTLQISLYEYINRTDDIEIKYPWLHYVSFFALPISVALIFIIPQIGAILTVCSIIFNIIYYQKEKGHIEVYLNVFTYILNMIHNVKDLSKMNLPGLEQYTDELTKHASKFNNFARGAGLVLGGRSMTAGLMDIILDYFRILFHIDLIKFNSMLKQLRANREDLNQMYEIVGLLDSMIAVASFRELIKVYTIPQLSHTVKPYIHTNNIYHPLIAEPVKNSFHTNRSALLTGSNASGKSTFLKTLAINGIFAQTIYTVLADSYDSCYFKIASSMALHDSLQNNESYYIVEIKSLKRIMDKMNDSIPVLCFVDEVLRGTNTLERIAASSHILQYFTSFPSICVAATHDIELTHILENYYDNYHFQEDVVENDVLFDYILYKGRAESRNAIKLLGIIGFDHTIIKNADKQVNAFLKTGTWSTL